MALKTVSIGELYAAWTIVFMLAFSPIAMLKAANSVEGIVQHLAAASGVAALVAAWFAGTMWVVIRVVS